MAAIVTIHRSYTTMTDGQLNIPGSFGELFDKITILQIKSERIQDPAKKQNILHELSLLRELEAQCDAFERAKDLVTELRRVNEALWDIEDEIRDCERQNDFGEKFIKLARAVYKTNDRRSEIKKEINNLYGSDIVEEKSYQKY